MLKMSPYNNAILNKVMIQSFKYAFTGIKDALKSEPNLRVHLLAGFLAFNLAYILNFTYLEWAVLVVIVSLVVLMELVNTIVEKVIDIVSPQKSERARLIKDISAAIVLITAITSVLVGLLLFLPKILQLNLA